MLAIRYFYTSSAFLASLNHGLFMPKQHFVKENKVAPSFATILTWLCLAFYKTTIGCDGVYEWRGLTGALPAL
jgi:hypothetical protein